ncbi:DUF3168 domain-containing protein [Mongoliimonas terrestris]|uniref:DUF3168 domain-containing protein n=1 Tax=Mongoliimonas terrestris TaxID=1709001 RepID=UPI000949A7A5|nr:DUF3168 domain-containing protein [Mongoliimonas terrestris]
MTRQTAILAAVEAAVLAALAADGTLRALTGGRIHGGQPKTRLTPFLMLAEARVADFGHGDGDGARLDLALEAVGGETGRAEALAVIDRAAAVLETAPLPLAAGTLVLKRLRAATVARGTADRTWRARVSLDLMVDA